MYNVVPHYANLTFRLVNDILVRAILVKIPVQWYYECVNECKYSNETVSV